MAKTEVSTTSRASVRHMRHVEFRRNNRLVGLVSNACAAAVYIADPIQPTHLHRLLHGLSARYKPCTTTPAVPHVVGVSPCDECTAALGL